MQTIVVTGGSSGVGGALIARLVAAGHDVWNLDVQTPIDGENRAHHIDCDLSRQASINSALNALPANIDALANIAGIARSTLPDTVVAVNFLGLRHLSEALLQRLTDGGAVVSVSSIAGRDWQAKYQRIMPLLETGSMADGLAWCEANREYLARDPYTFSKRCVSAYTLRTAQTALAQGLRINCVSPGVIDTPLYPEFEALMSKPQSDWMIDQAGRSATPDDIAEVIDLLCTAACGWLNGVDIPVDGGYSAGIESGWIDFNQSPLMSERENQNV
jgi:NAD(P)-dependent dehydrogenase (short-subunit alcohol dehydrogenase family)